MCQHSSTPNQQSATSGNTSYTQTANEIGNEFYVGSAIPRQIFDSAVEIIPDVEYDSTGREVESTPINDILGWRYTRFTKQAKPNTLAAVFRQEDGSPWMLKIYDGKKEYRIPKGNGDVPYLPHIPLEVGQRIAAHYKVKPPEEGESLWNWLERNKKVPLLITEGGKKALSVIGIGVPATALYGCRCGAKTKDREGNFQSARLIPQLEPLVEGRKVFIAFDQDTKPTARKGVAKGVHNLGRALKNAQAEPYVVNWNPDYGKGIDDVIAKKGAEVVHELLECAVPYDIHELEQRVRLTHKPSLVINTAFIGNLEIPEDKRFIAIRSAKGTGKTTAIAKLVNKYTRMGKRVLVITHRVKLGEQIAKRLGINYVSEIWENVIGKSLGFCLCIDSLHQKSQAAFNPDHWADEDYVVIIDEVEQVIDHMLDANTSVKKFRAQIIENFQRVIENAGQVIIAEADVSDKAINYIRSLMGEAVKPWILLNKYKSKGYQIYHYNGKNPDHWLYRLIEYIRNGGRPLISTDTKKTSSKWSTKNLELLINILFPEIKTLRLDSETLKDPEHPAYGCMSRLDEILPAYDILIASPCLETGVSIEIEGLYSSVWSKSEGVQASNAFRQTTIRYRPLVARHLYVAPRGKSKGETTTSAILSSTKRGYKNQIRLLSQLDESDLGCQYEGIQSLHLKTWAWGKSNVNAQNYHYREYTLYKLEEEGHRIAYIDIDEEDPDLLKGIKDTSEKLECIGEKSYRKECEDIANARTPSQSKREKLKKKKAKTKKERDEERKGLLSERYKEENVTPDLVSFDDDGLYPELWLLFLLTVGRDKVEKHDTDKIKDRHKKNNGKLFIPDIVRDTYLARVTILEILKIPELLEVPEDEKLHKDHPLIVHIAETARKYPKDIKASFNHRIDNIPSNIQIAQMFLGKVGFKMPRKGKKGEKNAQIQQYGKPISKYPTDVVKYEEFFLHWLKQIEETEAGKNPVVTPLEIALEEKNLAQNEVPVSDPSGSYPQVYIDITTTPPGVTTDRGDNEENISPPPPELEWGEVATRIDSELERSGWTVARAKQYLFKTYGVYSRHLLTDDQVLDFLSFLEQQHDHQAGGNSQPEKEPNSPQKSGSGAAEFHWEEIIARIDAQVKRIGWTISRAKDHLLGAYGVQSLHLLTDEQVFDFLNFLEQQPDIASLVVPKKSPGKDQGAKWKVGAVALFQGVRVRIERIINRAVALVQVCGTVENFEVALAHLKPG